MATGTTGEAAVAGEAETSVIVAEEEDEVDAAADEVFAEADIWPAMKHQHE